MNLTNTIVADVMQRNPVSIRAQDSLVDAARMLAAHRFHAAPVTDEQGVCIGIITSSDLVRFETARVALESQFHHGHDFDSARYANEASTETLFRFDQVGAQMTRNFRSVAGGISLLEAITIMHRERLHHLLVLDGLGKPYGVLSSLDILGRLIGQHS